MNGSRFASLHIGQRIQRCFSRLPSQALLILIIYTLSRKVGTYCKTEKKGPDIDWLNESW